jgi:hypothetical protein
MIVVRLEKRYPVAKIKLPAKIGWLVVTVMAFGSSLFWNNQGSAVNAFMTWDGRSGNVLQSIDRCPH